jgi:hypothetical protein
MSRVTHLMVLIWSLSVGGAANAEGRLPDDIDGLIELLAISDKPAGNEPIYTPGPETPRNDPRWLAIDAAEGLRKKGVAAFPNLVQHLDDKRQSVAFRSVIPHDVGDACFCIIREQVFSLPKDYRRSYNRTGADTKSRPRPYFIEPVLFDHSTLPKWLEQRKDKSLREMQIEALTWLIEEERKIGFRNEEDKRAYLDPLERRLGEIKAGKPLTEPRKKAERNPFE